VEDSGEEYFSRLGQALRLLREERGLTQQQLSQATRQVAHGRYVRRSKISEYELGRALPSLRTLGGLLEALRVTLRELETALLRARRGERIFESGRAAATTEKPRGSGQTLPAYLVVDLQGSSRAVEPEEVAMQLRDLVGLSREALRQLEMEEESATREGGCSEGGSEKEKDTEEANGG